jgi:NADPH:quinone reductase|tara:strand:- start:854 stop:1984 length:1131 start_codon:yes stop_codon:yes gene_type:complete
MTSPTQGLQLTSTVHDNGTLHIVVQHQTLAQPADDEVMIEVQATPLNPSDIGLLCGAADMSTAVNQPGQRAISAQIPERAMPAMAGRMNQVLPVGNEGAGRVIAAGNSEAAQALMGKTVAVLAGGMYAQYRTVKAGDCLLLPDGITPAQGASCFVNPLTALGFVETMKREGHTAMVHTAAASNLGQMLNKICLADGIDLVNIVRQPAQAELLRGLGARYVCDSSAASFMEDLTAAMIATGATIGFDATGGGTLTNHILRAMEAALSQDASTYSRYGSSVKKQVYVYGNLDLSPTQLTRSYGMAWSVGGWLVFPYLQQLGEDTNITLRKRVVDELTTTFASHYAQEISLSEVVDLTQAQAYYQRATSSKFLINPSKG